MQRKAQLNKISSFLGTVKELKRRFGTLATAFLKKKHSQRTEEKTEAEKELDDFEALIQNFDKKEDYTLNYEKKRMQTVSQKQS